MSHGPRVGQLASLIEAAQRRLQDITNRAAAAGVGGGFLQEALGELTQVLKELQAAGEGLIEGNDALVAACRAVEAVEAERERYRNLFELAPVAYLVTTADGVIREANRAAGALLGVDPPALAGEPLMRFVAEEQRRTITDLIQRIQEAPAALEVELDLLSCPGVLRPVAVTAEATREGRQDGPRGDVRWTMHDVTGLRADYGRRERLLAEAEDGRRYAEAQTHHVQHEYDTLQIVMENTQAQLAYLDADFRFVRVNAAFAQGSGHRQEELLGRGYFELFPDEESRAVFERVRDTGEAVGYKTRPVVRPGWGTLYWDWKLTPIPGPDGKTCGLVLSILDVTDRERLLDLLASERARLHAVIAHAPEGIVVTDDEGRVVLANDAAQALGFGTGLQVHSVDVCAEGATSKPATQSVPPLPRALAPGDVMRDVEVTVTRADGEQRDILVSAVPIRDGASRITGGVAVLQDVTEWKHTQEALRRYAERLQILHELDAAVLASHSVDAIASAALRHVWQLVPCRWAAVALFSEDMTEVALLAARADRETSLTAGWRGSLDWSWFAKELAEGQAHVVEDLAALPRSSAVITALREQGVSTLVNVPLVVQGRLSGSLNLGLAEPDGLLPEHVDVVQEMADSLAIAIHQADLNERLARHTQELERRVVERTAALRASEARFRTVFEESAVGIALLDLEGRVLDANPALQGLLDRELAALIGVPFVQYITVDDAGHEGESYAALLAGRCDYYRIECPYERHGGGESWANVTFSLVRRPGGIPWFAIVMVDDVTKDRAMRRALAEAEKLTLTGRLVASLTHEINNPLQAVIGCLGLAQEALAEGESPDRFLNVARDELRRTSGIVGHLRDLYRPIQPGHKAPGDANALIREVLDLSRRQIAGRGIHVVTELSDLPPVPMMADRMRQVVLNLVLNAVDAMPGGGRLYITTTATHRPEGVRVTFRDEGAGIAKDILPHIFDSFYTTKEDGLGLGLFITRGIVREHGGTISASSQPGKGTTFTIWLPLGGKAAGRSTSNAIEEGTNGCQS